MDTPQPLSFSDFLEKMKDPAAADLVRHIKSFIKQFEDRAPNQEVDAEKDRVVVQAFMAKSEDTFRTHPVWRGSLPAVLDQAVEGLEKYIMSKIWRQTFGVSQEDKDRDERYSRLMRALGFVDLPTLLGVEGVDPDPSLLAMAQGELLKMDKYKAPRDKLLCLVNVKTMVENIVQEAVKRGARIGGADAFFPVLLFVVIRSCLPRLASNVEFIKRFRTASRLTGQFDYMLCNLESSAMYLDTVDYQDLHISQEDFLARLSAAGIPEAHLELQRLQRQQQLGMIQGGQGGAAAAEGEEQGGQVPSPRALSSPRALEAYRQQRQQQEGPGMGGDDQECDDGVPGARRVGDSEQQPELTRGGGEEQQVDSAPPEPGAAGTTTNNVIAQASRASGIGGEAVKEEGGLSPLPQGTPIGLGSVGPRGGSAGGCPALDAAERQMFQDNATSAAVGASSAVVEPSFVETMVWEGTRHVLAAEARGELQLRYPFMYAFPAELSVADVERLLAGYKALVFRYEALALSLHSQLGEAAPPEQAGRQLSTAALQFSSASLEGAAGDKAQQAERVPPALAHHCMSQPQEAVQRGGLEQAGGRGAGAESPSRCTLLQSITSLSGRASIGSSSSSGCSNRGEMAGAGTAAPAQQLPALSTKAKEVLQGPGASLLNRLLDSPQRQGQHSIASNSSPSGEALPAGRGGGAAPRSAADAAVPTLQELSARASALEERHPQAGTEAGGSPTKEGALGIDPPAAWEDAAVHVAEATQVAQPGHTPEQAGCGGKGRVDRAMEGQAADQGQAHERGEGQRDPLQAGDDEELVPPEEGHGEQGEFPRDAGVVTPQGGIITEGPGVDAAPACIGTVDFDSVHLDGEMSGAAPICEYPQQTLSEQQALTGPGDELQTFRSSDLNGLPSSPVLLSTHQEMSLQDGTKPIENAPGEVHDVSAPSDASLQSVRNEQVAKRISRKCSGDKITDERHA